MRYAAAASYVVACAFSLALLSFGDARAQQTATWGERTDQSVIGSVRGGETGEALPRANVFLDGTTRGTTTDAKGRFHLRGVPEGTYKLVVSRIGYETLQTLVTVPRASERLLRFRPDSQPVAHPGVTVRGNNERWKKRYERFAPVFLGRTPNVDEVHIENPSVLSFEVSEDTLLAHANRPLKIANEALGYRIEYHLQRFAIHEGTFRRNGSGVFEEMKPEGSAEKNAWWMARRRAYHGSLMHFTRTLSRGRWERAGFRVHRTNHAGPILVEDGALELHPSLLERPVRKPQALRTHLDSTGFWLHFDDHRYLMVTYRGEREHARYLETYQSADDGLTPSDYSEGLGRQVSWIIRPPGRALLDARSGLTLTDQAPVLTGYWGWTERLAERLPRSYRPGEAPAFQTPPSLSADPSSLPPPIRAPEEVEWVTPSRTTGTTDAASRNQ